MDGSNLIFCGMEFQFVGAATDGLGGERNMYPNRLSQALILTMCFEVVQ